MPPIRWAWDFGGTLINANGTLMSGAEVGLVKMSVD